MIFAHIKNSVVVNTIVLDDQSLLPLFANDPMTGEPYDFTLQVDTTYPQPGIGWLFDGIRFIAPPGLGDPDEPSGGLLGGGGIL